MTTRMNIIVYTCIVDGYDDLLEPVCVDTDIDYYCVSERPVHPGSLWRHIPISTCYSDPAATNRYVKMHPHEFFPDADLSIYVDGNIRIVSSPVALVQKAMSQASIALYQHFSRNCVYDEAAECSAVGHDWLWRVNAQMERYRQDGFNAGSGLFEGNVIIRRHNQPQIIQLMDLWWAEYLGGVKRDQLSLPYLLWKTATPVYNLGVSDQRCGRTVFSLDSIHRRQPFATKVRGIINRIRMRFKQLN